jgi:hypothetical protein
MIIYKNIKRNCKLVTANGLANNLENYLNIIYKNKFTSNAASLVIVLRKFWFYGDYFYDGKPLLKSSKNINYFLSSGVDCFLFSDNTYYPLIRNDTSVAIDEKLHGTKEGNIIAQHFTSILNSLLINTNILKKKRLSAEKLNEYYDKNFQKPILEDADLKRGVYMNFNEFLKNIPSQTNFDVRKTKLADDIYLINESDTFPTRHAWGYCDGKNVYIKQGINLYKLFRQKNGFAFIGSKELKQTALLHTYVPFPDFSNPYLDVGTKLGLSALTLPHDKYVPLSVPLHLDMETGEVY